MRKTCRRYVAEAASRLLGKPLSQTNVITCHLGKAFYCLFCHARGLCCCCALLAAFPGGRC